MIRIGFEDVAGHVSSPPRRVLWSRGLKTFGQDLWMVDAVRCRRPLPYYPDWRLCEYLPLADGGSYTTGISIYCDSLGVYGLSAHGTSLRQVGTRRGLPIHFHFRPGEYLISFLLCTIHAGDSLQYGTFPLVRFLVFIKLSCSKERQFVTNRNRSALACPYLVSQHRLTTWSVVAASQSPITGLSIDALTPRSSRIQSIGASLNMGMVTTPPSSTILVSPESRFLNRRSLSFLTTGTLSGARKLQIRKLGSRCTGLCIYHNDGLVEALGQWNPSEGGFISTIYHHDYPLVALTFCYATDDPLCSHLCDVIVGDRPDINHAFVWRASDQQVFSLYTIRNRT